MAQMVVFRWRKTGPLGKVSLLAGVRGLSHAPHVPEGANASLRHRPLNSSSRWPPHRREREKCARNPLS